MIIREALEERLYRIASERIHKMPREDRREKTRSGMTKLQEYLRSHGIKEHRCDEPYDEEKYISTSHPSPFDFDGQFIHSLLFPRELALKILVLGHMP